MNNINKKTWLVVVGFSLLEIILILFPLNGPSLDESLYIEGGVYLLNGGDIYQSGYISLFNGSPFIWPIFAGFGFELGGTVGADLMALGFAILTLLMVAQATANLFGKTAAMWTAIMLSLNAHFVHLGHYAAYDIPSLAFMSISFWSITQYRKDTRRTWVFVAAVAIALATLTKYPFGIMLPILLMLLLIVSEKNVRLSNTLLFLFVSGVIISAYMLYFFQSLIPSSLAAYNVGSPGYLVVFIFQFSFIVVPLSFAIVGYRIAQEQQFGHLPKVLLGALFVWPLIHILANKDVSAQKHVVTGYLFAYPLVGLAMERLWKSQRRVFMSALLVGLVVWGGIKLFVIDHHWIDIRPAAIYLAQHVAPKDRIFNFDDSRWLAVHLQDEGLRDVEMIYEHELDTPIATSDLCEYQWIVNSAHDENALLDQALSESTCAYTLAFSGDTFDFVLREGVPGIQWETFDVYRVSDVQ